MLKNNLFFPILLAFLTFNTSLKAQDTIKTEIDTVSMQSIDGTIKMLYDVISGPAGPRNWKQFHALFAPYAQLVVGHRNKAGIIEYKRISPQEYIEANSPTFLKVSFVETETGRVVEEFQNIAQVFTSYSAIINGNLERPMKGINSIQLVKENGRWWIVSLMWDQLKEGEIPEKYLGDF